MPEKEAKSRCTGSRLSYFRKAGRAFGIGTLAMLANAHAEENGTHTPRPLGAPKLSACAVGIESVHYDFDRFLLSQSERSLRGGSSAFG